MQPDREGVEGMGGYISPPVTPPPVSTPSAISTPVPAVQPPVFGNTDSKPQYRQDVLRGLRSSQSGSGTPSSPHREMHRMLPPSTPVRVSFRFAHLSDTDKCLKEETSLPAWPSPRVPNPRIREEWGIQEAASLPATTRGQITN